MMNKNDALAKFLHSHAVSVRQVYMRRYRPISFSDYDYSRDYINYQIHNDEIPAVEMTIPLDTLTDLVSTHEHVEQIKNAFGPHALDDLISAQNILYKHRREESTRKNNPAVQKAWDNYKLLLKIAGE